MKTLIEKMETELAKHPELLVIYRSDFDIHDKATLSHDDAPEWIWLIRETGTHLWAIDLDMRGRDQVRGALRYWQNPANYDKVAPRIYQLRISRRSRDGRIYGDIVPITWDDAMMLLA